MWYRKAAEQGQSDAQAMLGAMYSGGLEVVQDYVQAYKWLDLAARNGNTAAVNVRDSTSQKMTPSQIVEAKRLVKEWRPN